MANPAQDVSLSSQEREILHLVRQGYRDGEIAGNLSLPVGAVASCLEQLSKKLGVRDRLELAILAGRLDS
jgi:DNA-binding NarL/FixJ family response regulator